MPAVLKRNSPVSKRSSLPSPPLKMAADPSPEVKTILKLTPDLTTALSNEPLGVANELLSKGLISDECYSEVLMPTSSATRKAAIMIESARKVIKLNPSKFTVFLEILSEMSCAARLVESLCSTYQSESAPASQMLQFSTPSNSATFTRTPPPSSMNTMSLASSMTGPSPSQMMQYQERSLAHHGIRMPRQHTRMEQLTRSHPEASSTTGMQPPPQLMTRFSQLSVEVPHRQMGMIQLPNMYTQQQAHYNVMGYNTTEMQLHRATSGHIGPSESATHAEMAGGTVYPHMIPHVTPPHHMHSATSMHSCSQMHQGEMIRPLHVIGRGCSCNV